MSVTPEVLDQWQTGSVVPLPEVARAVGMSHDHTAYALREGLIKSRPERGYRNSHMLDWDQVVMIVAAAAIAALAGAAIVKIMRSLQESGAQFTPGGVVIPMPLPGIRAS